MGLVSFVSVQVEKRVSRILRSWDLLDMRRLPYTYTVLKVLEYIERHLFMQPPRTLSSHGRSVYYSVRKTEMVAKNNGSR